MNDDIQFATIGIDLGTEEPVEVLGFHGPDSVANAQMCQFEYLKVNGSTFRLTPPTPTLCEFQGVSVTGFQWDIVPIGDENPRDSLNLELLRNGNWKIQNIDHQNRTITVTPKETE